MPQQLAAHSSDLIKRFPGTDKCRGVCVRVCVSVCVCESVRANMGVEGNQHEAAWQTS